MQVETYEINEPTASADQCEEAKALVEQLGLKEQERFYRADEPQACPYRKMTAQEAFVYEQVLSEKTRFEKFGDEAMPLRVLQVAAHAMTLFKDDGKTDLMVWHAANADIKDPLLVLSVQRGTTTERFILARWGEVLESFQVLTDKAKTIWKSKMIAEVRKGIADLQAYESAINEICESAFAKGSARNIYVSTNW